jgi:succinate dehydrogenase/fumarate reductase cytochrome b subunit
MIMSGPYDLRQIQRRTFQLMSFEDGLWDLLLGTIFIFLAIYPVTRQLLGPVWNLILFLSLLALVVVGQLAVRHIVSEPRIGYVRPRRSPKLRLLAFISVVMVLVTFGLVVWTLLSPRSGPTSSIAEALPGRSYVVEFIVLLVLGILFSAMGYLFGVVRLYFYGWMLGLANLASVYMEHNAGWVFNLPMAIAAGIILLIGFVLLVRFLRKYPPRLEAS